MSTQRLLIGSPVGAGVIARHFFTLAEELAHRGHEVTVVHPRTDLIPAGMTPSFRMLAWPSSRPTRLADGLFLAKLIARFRPHCVLGNAGAVNWMMFLGRLYAVRSRVLWYHTMSSQISTDTDLSSQRLRLLRMRKRCVYRCATRIVTVSEAARRDVVQTYRVPPHKCQVWRNALTDPAPEIPIPPVGNREKLIVCAGRLDVSKGQDVLLEALSLAREALQGVRTEFLGQGSTLDRLRELAQARGVAEDCCFAGRIPHSEVLRRMSRAAVTVVPSRSEAFGLVNIESMAVSTPVIASNVDGIPEVIRDGEDGFLVPPEDPPALAEKLVLMLQDPELRAKLGENARQRFLDRFENGPATRREADWFEELMGSRKAGTLRPEPVTL